MEYFGIVSQPTKNSNHVSQQHIYCPAASIMLTFAVCVQSQVPAAMLYKDGKQVKKVEGKDPAGMEAIAALLG